MRPKLTLDFPEKVDPHPELLTLLFNLPRSWTWRTSRLCGEFGKLTQQPNWIIPKITNDIQKYR